MAITKCESESYRFRRAEAEEPTRASFQTALHKANKSSPRDVSIFEPQFTKAGPQRSFYEDLPIPQHLNKFGMESQSFSTRWDGEILGIAQQAATPVLWPYRMYIREGVAERRDQKALQVQLAATPGLDPQAFGTRPAAPPDADRKIRKGAPIVVLDSTRLASLERQRDYLNAATNNHLRPEQRDLATEKLVSEIAREIDYASTLQGIPISAQDWNLNGEIEHSELGNLVRSIADRAPNDPIFGEAVEKARGLLEREWQADGRTHAQLGVLVEAAEKGDYARVAKEAERQLLDVARAAANGEPNGTPEVKLAALLRRAGVYQTYFAGDKDSYQKSVASGVEAAKQELFVNEPVRQLQAAWNSGGKDGASAFAAKLATLTSVEVTLPGYGAKIMSDPQVVGLLDQVINELSLEPSSSNDNFARQEDLLANLATASQNVLYGDGLQPDEGKKAVDRLADRLVAKVNAEIQRSDDGRVAEFLQPLARAGAEGNLALLLSFASKATGETRHLAISFAGNAITKFGGAMNALDDKIVEAYNDLYHGVSTWGSTNLASDNGADPIQQGLADMEKLGVSNPEKMNKLNNLGSDKSLMWERQESIKLALEHYRADLTYGDDDSSSLLRAYERLSPLPVEDLSKAAELADKNQKLPSTLWVQRSFRNLATVFMVEFTRTVVKPEMLRNVLVGTADTGKMNLDVLGRSSKGLSSYLFASNTVSVLNSDDWLDWLFAPMHGTVAVSHGLQAAFSQNWTKAAFGIDPKSGNANTFFQQRYNAAANRIDGMSVSEGTRSWMKGAAAAVLKDLADVGYVIADGTNAVVHGMRGDWITSAGYGFSVAGDAAFLAGPGVNAVQKVGQASAASGAEAAVGRNAASRFLLARSPFFYSGVGTVLMLIASGTVNGRGAWKAAHKYDAADADYLQTVMGVRPEMAAKLAEHNDFVDRGVEGYASLILPNENLLGGPPLMRSAGNVMMASLGKLGHTRSTFRDTVNNWTADQAETMAAYIKEQAGRLAKYDDPLEPEELLAFAKDNEIPLQDLRAGVS